LSETGGAVNTLSLSTVAGANDLIKVTGNVAFSGVNSLLLSGFSGVAPANGVYPLITYTGTLTGFRRQLSGGGPSASRPW
jgi:hypothetical protein